MPVCFNKCYKGEKCCQILKRVIFMSNFKINMKVCVKLGKSLMETFEMLQTACQDEDLSQTQI